MLTAGLAISSAQIPGVSANSDDVNIKLPTQQDSGLEPNPETGPGDDLISPNAIVVYVDEPIADKGTVSNYQIGQMIESYESGATWLNAINTILYAGGVTSPAGVVNSLASLFAGDIDRLREAYYSGHNMYWVATYASGVDPSLTKIYYHNYGNTPIRYIEV
ncbi:hypothetical protein [Bacillus fonticola]|uniref:hypothetical protein n=1 Tax=Bacillus fonticola TaxID=2728853 RepID=UPI001473DAAC|nr:hypothetical protein [Bacillus fonticola]